MPTQRDVPQRSDAQRNRERIVEVAAAELARDPDVPLSVIAKKAGVGQGTLYRNFADREALLWAIYRHEVQRLVDRAHDLLESSAPEVALREWMVHLARFARTKTGIAGAMHQGMPRSDDQARTGRALVVDTIGALLEANRRSGTIRPDVTADDFVLAVAGIWMIPPDTDWEAKVDRLLDLVMAGLQAGTAGARPED